MKKNCRKDYSHEMSEILQPPCWKNWSTPSFWCSKDLAHQILDSSKARRESKKKDKFVLFPLPLPVTDLIKQTAGQIWFLLKEAPLSSSSFLSGLNTEDSEVLFSFLGITLPLGTTETTTYILPASCLPILLSYYTLAFMEAARVGFKKNISLVVYSSLVTRSRGKKWSYIVK